jgi:hypothetical protein
MRASTRIPGTRPDVSCFIAEPPLSKLLGVLASQCRSNLQSKTKDQPYFTSRDLTVQFGIQQGADGCVPGLARVTRTAAPAKENRPKPPVRATVIGWRARRLVSEPSSPTTVDRPGGHLSRSLEYPHHWASKRGALDPFKWGCGSIDGGCLAGLGQAFGDLDQLDVLRLVHNRLR